MNITLNGTKITQDTRNLAFEKNSGVDEIVITVDTDESWSYKLDVKYPDKYNIGNDALYNIIDLDRNGNICSVTLTSEMLPFNGKYTMQLRGINGDKAYHSDTFEAWVKYSIEPGSTYNPVPSEFYQVEARLDDKVDEAKQYAENAETASTRMPKISSDNTWLIWDVGTGDYVDTGIKASGGGSGTSDHSLTFTGAVTGSYDGSAPLTVDIPAIDSTLTVKGKVADAKAVGDALITLSEDIASLQTRGLTTAQVNALDGMFKVCAFTKDNVSAEYTAFKTAFGIADSGGGDGDPDEPVTPDVTLTSISATYDGGDVAVGTAVDDLTGIVVTAHYSDGSTAVVTGYTLSGTIAEGENTVTVIYGGKSTTFTVTGIAESSGENNGWTDGEEYAIEWARGYGINSSTGENEEVSGRAASDYLPCHGVGMVELSNIYTNYGIFYYAEDKTFISKSGTVAVVDENRKDVRRDAFFIRVQTTKPDTASVVSISSES